MINYLITGGAGFIGSHLSEYLLNLGRGVVAVDNLSGGSIKNISHLFNNVNFKFVNVDIRSDSFDEQLIKSSDYVVHLAASMGPELIFEKTLVSLENNLKSSEKIIKLCYEYDKKLFIASSSEVYGRNSSIKLIEEAASILGNGKKSRWTYACSKMIDEFLALGYAKLGLKVVVGRFFNTIGFRQSTSYGMVAARFIEWAVEGKPLRIYGDGKSVRSFCDVRDVIKVVVSLLEEYDGGEKIFNIGSENPISIRDLALKIKEITRSDSELVYVPYQNVNQDYEDVEYRCPSIEKIKKELNWKPTFTIDDTVKEMFEKRRSAICSTQ